jgi:LmbE family N-acetylglucosaminyl deacetylase
MNNLTPKSVAVIVAHPDDETLWAGGTILQHPSWEWFIVSLCRGSDPDRAPKFNQVLHILGANGMMGDLNDGPEQLPLQENEVEDAVLNLMPPLHFDIIITHNPSGEYTRHIRHEEISRAVILLWSNGKLSADELWTFGYDDDHKKHFPKPVENATMQVELSHEIWLQKYQLITQTYGYDKDSWEAYTCPQAEAFWRFTNPEDAVKWLNAGGITG